MHESATVKGLCILRRFEVGHGRDNGIDQLIWEFGRYLWFRFSKKAQVTACWLTIVGFVSLNRARFVAQLIY